MSVALLTAVVGALLWPGLMAHTLYERYHSLQYQPDETFTDRVRYNFKNIDIPRTLGWAMLMSVVGAVLGYVFGAGLAAIFL